MTNVLMHLMAYNQDVYKEVKVKFISGLVNLILQIKYINTHVTKVHQYTHTCILRIKCTH